MVAARLALPRAVEEAVRVGEGVLVEVVVPGRLALAAHPAGAEGRVGQGKAILAHSGDHVSVQVLSGDILRGIQLAAQPEAPNV